MTPFSTRSLQLIDLFSKRLLVKDGAMGTAIQGFNLTADDFGGPAYEGCNEMLCVTRPEIIQQIHENHLKAGCDIVLTNSFGGTPLVLAEFELGDRAYEIGVAAGKVARQAAAKFSTSEKPRFVGGSMGPTTKAISVTGGITFEDLEKNYYEQAKALYDGGVDYFLLETCQDMRNVKAGLLGIDRLLSEKPEKIPVAVSVTIEPMGTMLAGQSVEAVVASLAHRDLLYMGLNCATGPEFMTDHVRTLAALAPWPVACVPNAGLPDEEGQYLETPDMLCAVVERFVTNNWVNLVGGCCGTTDGHIHKLSNLAASSQHFRKKPGAIEKSILSGVDFLEITDEMRPVLVGERTNVIGSRKFKRLITDGKWDEAGEIARAQIKNGAQIIDICLANPDRDELSDMKEFLEKTIQKIRVPMMIDSTDAEVIALALTYSQGKAIINSINLEDGEERFEAVVPLGKKFGSAFVVGTIDDDPIQGMGVTRQRKLEIARRSYNLLTEKYGVAAEDIYFDPLVFPCGTGDAQYVGSGVETIEGIRLIKKEFPKVKTVLGISNISFGLPENGREVLNSVFLYHCVQAGLDLAIVNSEKLERYASIPDVERQVAEDLIWNRGADPVATFAAQFREKKPDSKTKNRSTLSLDARLSSYIIEGSKDGLVEDLNEKLKEAPPLAIINGPLMAGMDEVGRLFNANKLIVAEVLQSAEAMKAAVGHLEPLMEKNDTVSRGKVILATVKGDVHDIGKNLVEIILSNNGFKVINLGIKIPPEQLIAAIREHKPDIVGLSGLLVKSAQQMVITAEDLSKVNVTPRMLVGGAALSQKFVDKKIAPAYLGTVAYASDAMTGLDLSKKLINETEFQKFKTELEDRRKKQSEEAVLTDSKPKVTYPQRRSSSVNLTEAPPHPTDYKRHILRSMPIEQIWGFINPLMLYNRHLGINGAVVRKLEASKNDPALRKQLETEHAKSYGIWKAVQDLKEEYRKTDILQPTGVYQFFRSVSDGNDLYLLRSNGVVKAPLKFSFPRQNREEGLCLSDYVNPGKSGSPEEGSVGSDNVALFAVTVGHGVRAEAERLKQNGDYLKSHILQALAIESAEGFAELLHSELRKVWGFPDPVDMTLLQRFQAKYRGKRYSFGYPACPNLDDQKLLFEALKPQEIGIELTEGFMMDPEASVSAIVFHHPQAIYYSTGTGTGAEEGSQSFEDQRVFSPQRVT